MCYRTRKYTVCRCAHASFSPEILQASAVKGLTLLMTWNSPLSFVFRRANAVGLCNVIEDDINHPRGQKGWPSLLRHLIIAFQCLAFLLPSSMTCAGPRVCQMRGSNSRTMQQKAEKQERRDRKKESNDSPEIADRGKDIRHPQTLFGTCWGKRWPSSYPRLLVRCEEKAC